MPHVGPIPCRHKPSVAAVHPRFKAVRTNEFDGFANDVLGQRFFLKKLSLCAHEHAAVEAGDGGVELQRFDQHFHAARRTATGDSKSDVGIT